MVDEMQSLADQFKRLELHAAKAGREVRRVLLDSINPGSESRSCTINDMLDTLHAEIIDLLPYMPPYAPPFRSMNDLLVCLEGLLKTDIDAEQAFEILSEMSSHQAVPQEVAEHCAQYLFNLLPQHASIYTHTLSETVLSVIQLLYAMNRVERVIVTESRPNLDGHLTAQQLVAWGIPVYLTIDAAMPTAIESTDLMLTGAEAIDATGQVVGKVGAFSAAVLCQLFDKPVYVVADSNKLFPLSLSHLTFIPISKFDLRQEGDSDGWHPFGFYFDETPGKYIHKYVNEYGDFSANQLAIMVSKITISPWLMEMIGNH